MSFLSRRALFSAVAGLALTACYTVIAVAKGWVGSTDVPLVARMMLAFIGISVVALILVLVGVHVTHAIRVSASEKRDVERVLSTAMVEDEMERLIGLKAGRATSIGAGVGIVGLLAVLACGLAPGLALHVLLWGCAAGGLAEGCLIVWYAERGVSHA